MIKNLRYSVTFPTNGIALSGDFSWQPGITAVVGDNGSGKTFGSIEMPRYLLFGKKALRGPARDYKTLTGNMTFAVKGEDYTVERTPKFERLTDAAGEVLAVGAEAVTQKITQILGFGLDVFDVVCCSVQKDTDRLTKLKPAERKALIDQVIGLTATETAEKACRTEATGLRREADALTDALYRPEEPVRPVSYQKSSELTAELTAEKALLDQRRKLEAIINGVGPAPEMVEAPVGDLQQLIDWEANRELLAVKVTHARSELAKIPPALFTAEEIDAAEILNKHMADMAARGDRPSISREAVEAAIEQWQHRALVAKMVDTEATCPKCDHVFRTGGEMPPAPAASLAECQAELRRHDNWPDDPEPPKAPKYIGRGDIANARLALARAGDIAELEATIAIELPENRSAELEAFRRQTAQHDAYLVAKDQHDARSEAAMNAAIDLEALPAGGDIADLERRHIEARIYETQAAAYDVAMTKYQELSATVAEKAKQAAAFKDGGEALVKARQTVKAHLAPSLSRVSSTLINEMSGGVFTHMIVDEDMNINVDGQDIATLSGAGSTVANLALRLALGQVLVNSVFPVFIADEADSDLSHSRAQFTADCLKNLKSRLSQIIIITHKEVTVADHVITR